VSSGTDASTRDGPTSGLEMPPRRIPNLASSIRHDDGDDEESVSRSYFD